MKQIFSAMLLGPLMSLGGSKKMGGVSAKPNQKDLTFMKELFEAGEVKPIIDKRYALSDLPEALSYLGEGHAQGKIVINHKA
jgi:NADPH:quinone reductase-like Zn-dependent oxidoreductase